MTFEQTSEGGKGESSEEHSARGPSQCKDTEVVSGPLWLDSYSRLGEGVRKGEGGAGWRMYSGL